MARYSYLILIMFLVLCNNLLYSLKSTEVLGKHDSSAFLEKLDSLSSNGVHCSSIIKSLDSLLQDTKHSASSEFIARTNFIYSKCLLRLGEWDKAILRNSVPMDFFKSSDPIMFGEVLLHQGNIFQAELELMSKTKVSLHELKKQSQSALSLYTKADSVFQEQSFDYGIAKASLNIGVIKFILEQDDSALKHYKKAEKKFLTCTDLSGLGSVWSNIGLWFLAQDQLDSSKKYTLKAHKIFYKLEKPDYTVSSLLNLAYILEKDSVSKAINYLTIADSIVAITNNLNQRLLIEEHFQHLYANGKNYEKAYNHLAKYQDISLKLRSESFKDAELNMRYDFNRVNELTNAQKLELTQKELDLSKSKLTARTYLFSGIIVLIASILSIAYLLFNRNRKRIKLEKEIEAYEIQKEYEKGINELELATVRLEGEKQERSRIADELHDGVVSTLMALGLKLQLSRKHQNFFNKEIVEAQELLELSIDDIRSISHNLNEGIVLTDGLLNALNSLKRQYTKVIEISIDTAKGLVLDKNVETQVFRIIQELVNNVLKHAEASKVTISLKGLEDVLIIVVQDNGKGFELKTETLGIGISSIHRRVQRLKGTVRFISNPKNGTKTIVQIPMLIESYV